MPAAFFGTRPARGWPGCGDFLPQPVRSTLLLPASAQGVIVTGATGDPMRCASCNRDNPADASFCEECGAKLELICPACKASVSPGARFCKKCGTAIGPTNAATSTTISS